MHEGATNVKWVWSPNAWWSDSLTLERGLQYYPGDAYVDWMALDGYNSTGYGWTTWKQVFGLSYNGLARFRPTKPIMIAETDSSEPTPAQAAQGVTKAGWITDAFRNGIPAMPHIKAVLWFNEDKTAMENCLCNWQIESSPGAQSAFAQAVANPYYLSNPQ